MTGELVRRITAPTSYTAIRLTLARRVDGVVVADAQATGVFWSVAGRLWLITNLHNVTGWDFIRDRAMSSLGFFPTEVQMHLCYREPLGRSDGAARIARTIVAAQLYRDEKPIWYVHPLHGTKVDVAAVSIGQINAASLWPDTDTSRFELANEPINLLKWADFELNAGDEAFVLGYPKGLDGGEGYPIWKRASVASEPDIEVDALPKILIDTATRQGMSGSPVIILRRGLIPKSGGTEADTMIGTAANILGIYSGRVDDDPLGAQIGIVWKRRVVEEIIAAGILGKMPWD